MKAAVGRIAWLLAGVTWAARSMLEWAHPDYWNSVTTLRTAMIRASSPTGAQTA